MSWAIYMRIFLKGVTDTVRIYAILLKKLCWGQSFPLLTDKQIECSHITTYQKGKHSPTVWNEPSCCHFLKKEFCLLVDLVIYISQYGFDTICVDIMTGQRNQCSLPMYELSSKLATEPLSIHISDITLYIILWCIMLHSEDHSNTVHVVKIVIRRHPTDKR